MGSLMKFASAMTIDPSAAFITRWKASGAGERANCQLFLSELCDLIGVASPKSDAERRPAQSLRLRTHRHISARLRRGQHRPHRSLQARMLRPGSQTGMRPQPRPRSADHEDKAGHGREGWSILGAHHEGGAHAGADLCPRPAALGRLAALPDRGRCRPLDRVVRRFQLERSTLQPLSRAVEQQDSAR